MPLYLGLDCGGTSCRALALDGSGEPVFLSQGGSANLVGSDNETLERSLSRALDGLPPVDYICACFAGLVSESTREKAERLVRKHVQNGVLRIEPDYAAALRAAPEGSLACVIAGTGSLVCSRGEGGALVRSGGGGYLLGDEGSGFRYGQAAFREYVRDPEAASAALRESVEHVCRGSGAGHVITTVYASRTPAPVIAAAASALFKDAEAGVQYAVRAIERETHELAMTVAGHLSRYHPGTKQPKIGLAGSVWKRRLVRETFAFALQGLVDGAQAVRSTIPPVMGAALLAREMEQHEQ